MAGTDLRQLFVPTTRKNAREHAFVMSGSNAEPDLRQIFNPTKTYCEQAFVMSGPTAGPDLRQSFIPTNRKKLVSRRL